MMTTCKEVDLQKAKLLPSASFQTLWNIENGHLNHRVIKKTNDFVVGIPQRYLDKKPKN